MNAGCEGKDKHSAGLQKPGQGSEERLDIRHVEERHVGEGDVERLLTEGKELSLVGCVYDVTSNWELVIGGAGFRPFDQFRGEAERLFASVFPQYLANH